MARAKTDTPPPETDAVVGEVIVIDSPGGDPGSSRQIRVYDRERGDFVIDVPSECRMTFGYFNPAASAAGGQQNRYGGFDGPGSRTMKTTCLRIYADTTDKRQLAAFLGVDGFRDLAIGLTRLKQRVVIESNYENDGDGYENVAKTTRRALNQVTEEGTF